MTPIDNSGFQAICGNCDCGGFVPVISWSFSTTTGDLTVTEGSTFPSGDGLAAVIIKVSDGKGHVLQARIATAGGNAVIDLTSGGFILGPDGFNILATVVTTARCTADMSAYGVSGTTTGTGTLGNTDLEPSPGEELGG